MNIQIPFSWLSLCRGHPERGFVVSVKWRNFMKSFALYYSKLSKLFLLNPLTALCIYIYAQSEKAFNSKCKHSILLRHLFFKKWKMIAASDPKSIVLIHWCGIWLPSLFQPSFMGRRPLTPFYTLPHPRGLRWADLVLLNSIRKTKNTCKKKKNLQKKLKWGVKTLSTITACSWKVHL